MRQQVNSKRAVSKRAVSKPANSNLDSPDDRIQSSAGDPVAINDSASFEQADYANSRLAAFDHRHWAQVKKIATPHLLPKTFSSRTHKLILGYCAFAGLSIAASQVVLIALLIYWVAFLTSHPEMSLLRKSFNDGEKQTIWLERFTAALFGWLLLSLLATFAGINFLHSLPELFKTSIYLLLPLCLYHLLSTQITASKEESYRRIVLYLLVLCGSLTLAAIHTVVSTAAGRLLPPKIPGALTESGQLVLLLPVAIGLLIANLIGKNRISGKKSNWIRSRELNNSALLFLLLLVCAWPNLLQFQSASSALLIQTSFAAIAAGIFGQALHKSWKQRQLKAIDQGVKGNFPKKAVPEQNLLSWLSPGVIYLLSLATALQFCALVLNLKRGPWMGTICTLVILGACWSRKLLFASIGISAFLLLILTPARERLGESAAHFSIYGGRLSMWSLGVEIAGRFPLGLGPDNASYMQVLDPSLPTVHRHMHNNYLNIAVESGWLGLAAFFWWSLVCILIGFDVWRRMRNSPDVRNSQLGIIALSLSAALVGWQVSGLVEYNFGDGEIRLIVFFFMGLLLSLAQLANAAIPEESAKKELKSHKKKR